MTDKHPAPAATPRPARRRLAARCKRWVGPLFTAALAIIAGVVLWNRMRQETWAYYTDGADLRAEVGDSTLRPVLWEDPEPHHFDGGEDGKPAEANAPSGRLEAAFSADGTQLLLVRRPDADRGTDMFISRWDGRRWSRPEPLKSINTPSNELGPAFSRCGKFLYFSSDRDGGRGGYDLYVARWDGKQWTAVKPLPESVNTGADEHGPALSPDGTQLYFSSDRGGSEDIFVSDITAPKGNGKKQRLAPVPEFAEAKAVDDLNSKAADVQAALTSRGEHVFLASDRHRDGDSGFKVYFSRVTNGKAGTPEEVDLYIDRGDVTDPAVRMEGYDLLFSAGGADPGYRLYRSTTREVIGYTDFSRWLQFKQLMRNIAWWLLLAVAALIALIYVLEKWRDITNLYHKCLAGSALIHILALLLAAVWLIAREISDDEQSRLEEVEVELDALSQEELALESIPEETELTDSTAVETQKEQSEFGAPGFEPREEAQDVPDAAAAAKEAVVEAKPTMSDPSEQPVIEPPAESNLPNELTATVLPEIEPTMMEERDPDQAPTAANPAEEMFEPDSPATEATKAESEAVADQAVESEAQPTEVRPPEAAELPMESVVEAKATPPAEPTPADQPPLESEMLAQLPQEHFVDPDDAMLDESNPANDTPAEPSNELFNPAQAVQNLETAQNQSTPADDSTAATSTADAAAVPAGQAMADSPPTDGAPATPGESAANETLPPADLDATEPDGLPALALDNPAAMQMEEREPDTGASPADTTAEMFEPADPSTSPTASQARGEAVADTADASPSEAAAVAATSTPADAVEINMQPASAAATSDALPSSTPVAAADLPASSILDPTTAPLEEDGLTDDATVDTSNDQFKPGSPSTLAASQAQGQAVADTADASPSEAAAVAATGTPADAVEINMQPASAAATSDALPSSTPVAAADLPASSILDPTTAPLEEDGLTNDATVDTSNDQFKPGSPSTLAASQAQGQAVADTADASPSEAAAVAAAGSPADAAEINMQPASAAATSDALPLSDPLAAAKLPTSSIVDPTAPPLEEADLTAAAPADTSGDQFKPAPPSTLATSKAQGQTVADNAAASPSNPNAVAAAGSPSDTAAITMRPASSAAISDALPASNPLAAANLPVSSILNPTPQALEELGRPAGAPADTSKEQFKPGSPSTLATSKAQGQSVADNAAASPSDAAAVAAAGSPSDTAAISMRPASSAATTDTLPTSNPLAAAKLPASSILNPTPPALEELGRPAGAPANTSRDQFKPGSPSTLATSKAQGAAVADSADTNPADAAAVAATGSPGNAAAINPRPAKADPPSGSLPAPTPIAAADLPASSTPAPAAPTLEEPGKRAGAPADPSRDQFKPTASSGLTVVQSATNPGSGSARSDTPAADSVAGASRAESSSAAMPGRALETSGALTPGGDSLVITVTTPGSVSDSLLPTKLEAPDGALKASAMARVIRKQRGKPGIDTIKQMGGSDGTEKSINSAIRWLVENQEADGRWNTLKHGARSQYDNGAAGLALLCFYGWGERHDAPCKHRKNVRSALDWLLAQQDDDGYLGERTNMMYSHAIATIALCEAYGVTRDKRLRKPAERAIAYTLRAQSKSLGGWRYAPGDDSDTSITGWQYMALHSARMAGLEVPDEAFERVRKHLDRVGGGKHGGLYGYQGRVNPPPAMVATGMFCRQLDLVPPSDPMMLESARWLKMRPMETSRPDLYYVYYATLALYQHQGPIWNAWNEHLKEILPLIQHKTGDKIGSWDPSANITSDGGRVVSTALATLSLEVYYRLLPMYGFRNTEADPPAKKMR